MQSLIDEAAVEQGAVYHLSGEAIPTPECDERENDQSKPAR